MSFDVWRDKLLLRREGSAGFFAAHNMDFMVKVLEGVGLVEIHVGQTAPEDTEKIWVKPHATLPYANNSEIFAWEGSWKNVQTNPKILARIISMAGGEPTTEYVDGIYDALDARLDTLEEVIGEDGLEDGIVTYPKINTSAHQLLSDALEAKVSDTLTAGTVNYYDTKAAADAALAGLSANAHVEVFADETRGGATTRYQKDGLTLKYKTRVVFSTLFKNRDHVERSVISTSVSVIQTACHTSTHDAGGAIWVRAGSEPTHSGKLQDDGGNWWELDKAQRVNVCMFGAKRDASATAHAQIQAALDWAMQNNIQNIYVPEGAYWLEETLHLGYGDTFRSISLIGSGIGAYTTYNPGVRFLSQKSDRPVINIQGVRWSRISGIGFYGKAPTVGGTPYIYTHIDTIRAESDFACDPDPATWNDATNTATALDRYRPYAAITLDAYSGSRPGSSYPDVTYPAWTGVATQWGRSLSSGVLIDDCSANGFGAFFVSQPSGGDGNGDFITFDRCQVSHCVYGMAISHTQARNNGLRDCVVGQCHTALTTRAFGAQNGRFGHNIANLHAGAGYQIFDFGASGVTGSIHFSGLYCEGMCRLGRFQNSTTHKGNLTFTAAMLEFSAVPVSSGGSGRAPVFHLESGDAAVTFNGCRIVAGRLFTVGAIGHQGLATYNNCTILSGYEWLNGNATQTAGGAVAANATAGVFGFWRGSTTTPGRVTGTHSATSFNTATFAYSGEHISGDEAKSWIPHGTHNFVDEYNGRWQIASKQSTAAIVVSAWDTAPSITGMTFSGVYKNANQTSSGDANRLEIGDLLYNEVSGQLVVIDSITSDSPDWAISGTLLNDYIWNGTAFEADNAWDNTESGGFTYLVKSTPRMSRTVWFGDFKAGSTTVTNVHRGDTYGGNLDAAAQLYVGMPLAQAPLANYDRSAMSPNINGNMRIATLTTGSPGSLTLTRNSDVTGRFPIAPVILNQPHGRYEAETTFTPTVSVTSGSLGSNPPTATGTYRDVGPYRFVETVITYPGSYTAGSPAVTGALQITSPSTHQSSVLGGTGRSSAGDPILAYGNNSTTAVTVNKTLDGTVPAANSLTIILSYHYLR